MDREREGEGGFTRAWRWLQALSLSLSLSLAGSSRTPSPSRAVHQHARSRALPCARSPSLAPPRSCPRLRAPSPLMVLALGVYEHALLDLGGLPLCAARRQARRRLAAHRVARALLRRALLDLRAAPLRLLARALPRARDEQSQSGRARGCVARAVDRSTGPACAQVVTVFDQIDPAHVPALSPSGALPLPRAQTRTASCGATRTCR
jgi:hypothetical protein